MRQLRYVDHDCPSCGASCTRLVYFDTELERPDDQDEICGHVLDSDDTGYVVECQVVLVPREMSGVGYMKTISKQNSDFNERERERLEKRSDDHWRRQGRDEAIDRERAMLKKNGMVGGVK